MTWPEIRAKLADNQELMIKLLGNGYAQQILVRVTEYPPEQIAKHCQVELTDTAILESPFTFEETVGLIVDECLVELTSMT